MEEYVIIDSVLQALHMSTFNKKPKHLKKYQSTQHQVSQVPQNYTICCDNLSSVPDQGRFSAKPLKKLSKLNMFMNNNTQRNKLKVRAILQQSERISHVDRIQLQNRCFSQFFVKKQISPRSSRQHNIRTATLRKSHQKIPEYFYDSNLQFVRKKSRKCIILPESKRKNPTEKENLNNKHKTVFINAKQFVKKQIEQEKKRRKAQCKTSSCLMRHKTLLQKQAKKIQDQLKNKQNQQYGAKTYHQKLTKRPYFFQQTSKTMLPLSRDEMKSKTTAIMDKYGVDPMKCFLKAVGN